MGSYPFQTAFLMGGGYGYLTFSLMKMQGSSWSLNDFPHLRRKRKIKGIDI